MKLSQFLVYIGLADSRSEAKRLISQGAVSLIRDKKYILKADVWIAVD